MAMKSEHSKLAPIDLLIKRQRLLDECMDKPGRMEISLTEHDYTISTYPKAGTTWLQQIVHQLRTGGDEHFSKISMVIPWLLPESVFGEQVGDMGYTVRPRVFKTHLYYDDMVKIGGKHIFVMRNPEDTLWSYQHFLHMANRAGENYWSSFGLGCHNLPLLVPFSKSISSVKRRPILTFSSSFDSPKSHLTFLLTSYLIFYLRFLISAYQVKVRRGGLRHPRPNEL